MFAVGHSEYDASDYSSTGIGKAKCNGYVIALNDASTSYAMWGPKGQELGCYPKDEFGDPIQNGRENGQYNDWYGSSSEAAVDNPGPQDYFRYLMNMGTPSVSADGKDGAWFYARSVLAF